MNRLQGDPLGALVPGTCFVPWLLRCAAPQHPKPLASADGQGHEIARKLLKRALRVFLTQTCDIVDLVHAILGVRARPLLFFRQEHSEDRMDHQTGLSGSCVSAGLRARRFLNAAPGTLRSRGVDKLGLVAVMPVRRGQSRSPRGTLVILLALFTHTPSIANHGLTFQ